VLSDHQEEIVEKAVQIMAGSEYVICDEFTRFNTIYIGNIISGKVNCEIQLTLPAIAKLLGYDLDRFFKDRDFNFEKTLEYRIWHHENIPDDSPFIGIYEMDVACHHLEYSMLGVQPRWIPGEYPASGGPVLDSEHFLDELPVPDFFEDGFMPQLVEDYYRLKEGLNGRLEIGIRKFVQGPFQIATGLYGVEQTYLATLTNPDFVRKLMDFQVRFFEAWASDWEQLHGRKYGMVNLGEDEIDTGSMIRPKVWRELILPYHIEYGEQYDAIHWHSCGDVNAIMEDVNLIPHLHTVEIGPQTDALAAARIFASNDQPIALYKCVDIQKELEDPAPGAQEAVIENVLAAANYCPIKILLEAPSLSPALAFLEKFRAMTH
jgi:hypothetical protein